MLSFCRLSVLFLLSVSLVSRAVPLANDDADAILDPSANTPYPYESESRSDLLETRSKKTSKPVAKPMKKPLKPPLKPKPVKTIVKKPVKPTIVKKPVTVKPTTVKKPVKPTIVKKPAKPTIAPKPHKTPVHVTPVKKPTSVKAVHPTPVHTPAKPPVNAHAPVHAPANPPGNVHAPAKPPVHTPAKPPSNVHVPVKSPVHTTPIKNSTASKTATHAPTQTVASRSCKLPGKTNPKPAKKPRGLLASLLPRSLVSLFAEDGNTSSQLEERDSKEFLGYHGTNAVTAKMWMAAGYIKSQPPGVGTSGADAELDSGIYVTDNWSLAGSFARGNAQTYNLGKSARQKTTGMTCAVFAKSKQQWISDCMPKLWLPDTVVRVPRPTLAQKLAIVTPLMARYWPGVPRNQIIQFSAFNLNNTRVNQMLITNVVVNNPSNFEVQCVDAELITVPPNPLPQERPPPSIWTRGLNYRHKRPQNAWNIR